jgi:biopolymer transport protein ExbB
MTAIAEALVATALGLAVAIPAVVFYNMLTHSVNEVMEEAREMRHLILAAGLDTAARGEHQAGDMKAAPQHETKHEVKHAAAEKTTHGG